MTFGDVFTTAGVGYGANSQPGFEAQVNPWNTVSSYATYPEAQAAVDHLVSVGFPVQYLEIVGSDLRLVERVTGPQNAARAVMAGAGVGAWWGLLIGLLVGLFSVGAAWLGLVIGGILLGAAWGALVGWGSRWYHRDRHNFASLSRVVAGRYDVIALEGMATQARSALGVAA